MRPSPACSGRERHPAGFSVRLPEGCEVVKRGSEGLELRLAAADPPALASEAAGAQPHARVSAEPIGAAGLEAWVGRSLLEQTQHLVAPRLLHRASAQVAGLEGLYTVTHHLPDGRLSVTLAQWWAVIEDTGIALRVSLPTLDLAIQAPVLDLLAGGLELEEAAA